MSAMRPFNTSTKDTLSTKLRNFNASKSATRQLEVDSRRMEERLRELKMTMSQEKQERERQGSGGYWRSGKAGSLTTQAPKSGRKYNRNNTEMPRSSKSKKITVLKDEPIKIPKRAPKTVLNVTARKTFQGPACGQCEEKAAALSCMECGELYCAACFAQFHLKGALRLHRSVPYQAGQELRRSINNGPLSPRADMVDTKQNIERTSNHSEVVVKQKSPVSMVIHQQKSPVLMTQEQVMNGPSLLDGEYNEEDSSASFAAALAEWRGQPQVPSKATPSPRQPNPEVATVNEGTGTEQAPKQEIKIEFKELSMSYADKLLLKKHRRTKLPELPTQTPDKDRDATSRMLSTYTGPTSQMNDFVDDDDDEEKLEMEEEHLRYAHLFSTSDASLGGNEFRSRSVITITPLPDDVDISAVEEETSYLVQEEPDAAPVMYTVQHQQQPTTRNNRQNTQSSKASELNGKGGDERSIKKQQKKSTMVEKQKEKKSATDKRRMLPRPPSENSKENKTGETSVPEKNTSSQRKNSSKGSKMTHNEDDKTTGGKNTHNSNGQKRTSSRNRKLLRSSKVESESASLKDQLESEQRNEKRMEKSKKLTPKRPASAQPEQEASGRSSKTDGRNSRVKKRPVSAGITRHPSVDLVNTSKLAWKAQYQYTHGLDEFFMAGLDNQQHDTKEPTVANYNDSSTRLPKCTFQGPGFWRPDSSLSTLGTSYTAVTQFNADDNEQKSPHQKSPSTLSWRLSKEMQKRAESSDSDSVTPTQGMYNGTSNLERKPPDGREYRPSSCIEIEGDDFRVYDDDIYKRKREVTADDEDTLQQLASELESGRNSVDDDGPLSRLSMLEDFPDGEYNSFEDQLGIQQDDGLGSGLSTPCDELNIEQEMDEESMQGDFEEERIASVMEVKALE